MAAAPSRPVDALGHLSCDGLGALTNGHGTLKAHRPKRLHILQTAIELLPVPGGKGV